MMSKRTLTLTLLSCFFGVLVLMNLSRPQDPRIYFTNEESLIRDPNDVLEAAEMENANLLNNDLQLQPNNKLNCSQSGVLTTIFSPTETVRRFLYKPDWCIVVVGDANGPKRYTFPTSVGENIVFLPKVAQDEMNIEFVNFLPTQHFSRKNVGYLYAIAHGAKVIWDFDDDNMLKFWMDGAAVEPFLDLDLVTNMVTTKPTLKVVVPKTNSTSVDLLNPYPFLGCPANPCWPRGFPLDQIHSDATWNWEHNLGEILSSRVGILQSLADFAPDVDAIFRMTKGRTDNTLRPF